MHNSVLNDLKNLASKDLTNATAMPKELYSSNEILNLEEDLIFSKEWICVGRENEIPEVGAVSYTHLTLPTIYSV